MEDRDFDALIDRMERMETQIRVDHETIATLAAKKALDLVYLEVGKSTIRLAMWVVGAAVIALLAYLGATGRRK